MRADCGYVVEQQRTRIVTAQHMAAVGIDLNFGNSLDTDAVKTFGEAADTREQADMGKRCLHCNFSNV